MVRTLYHSAEMVVTQRDDIVEEKRHVGKALKKCGYPDWALVDVVSGLDKRAREECGVSSK